MIRLLTNENLGLTAPEANIFRAMGAIRKRPHRDF